MNWDKQILQFYKGLVSPEVPEPYEVLYPFGDAYVWKGMVSFYEKYYSDEAPRHMMIGINPGRFGAGVTGVPFTDPIRLKDACGIQNSWPRKPELSSIFMYEMMEAFGGIEPFYKQFYLTSVSPLGFVADGKNVNYYDDRKLAEAVAPFAEKCMKQQMKWNVNRRICFCIGEGKNLQYLQRLNDEKKWFENILPLSHPRFVMQYKRTKIDTYIQQYIDAFKACGIV
jgi:Domain of unknown function (DUF4918)